MMRLPFRFVHLLGVKKILRRDRTKTIHLILDMKIEAENTTNGDYKYEILIFAPLVSIYPSLDIPNLILCVSTSKRKVLSNQKTLWLLSLNQIFVFWLNRKFNTK